MRRHVLFRCDFGGATGWGHLVRSSALAEVARARGFLTGLVTGSSIQSLPQELKDSFDRHWERQPLHPDAAFWARCLGNEETLEAVFVDHYAYSVPELALVRSSLRGRALVHIHDNPSSLYSDADLAVCPGFAGEGVSGESNLCAGLCYTLLRSAFAVTYSSQREMSSAPKVAIILGGTDPLRLTPRVLDALYVSTGGACVPYVIVSRDSLDATLEASLQRFSSHRVLQSLDSASMAECFASCDYGITACGGTVYEMAAMDLPFLGICVAYNQYLTARAVEETWSMPVLDGHRFDETSFHASWNALKQAFPEGSAAYASIDGQGAARVLDTLNSLLGSLQSPLRSRDLQPQG